MGYRIRMHHEIHDWLTGLRGTEPELARLVGEALLAMMDAGESLGPPLVMPLGSVLQSPEDPRETLDYAYQGQLETLTEVRRGVAEVATSRKRVELLLSTLEQQAAKLAAQRGHALDAGNEDLASEVRTREAAIQDRLSELARQFGTLTGEEERLTAASQRLQIKVEAFRVQKETIKASYTAAEASRRVREAFITMGADTSEVEVPDAEADVARATTAADDLLQEIRQRAAPSPGSSGPPDEDDIQVPPGMMELRPGAPDDMRVGLLFVAEPPDTAVLLGWVEDAGGARSGYRDVIPIAGLPPGGSSVRPPGCEHGSSRLPLLRHGNVPRRVLPRRGNRGRNRGWRAGGAQPRAHPRGGPAADEADPGPGGRVGFKWHMNCLNNLKDSCPVSGFASSRR